MNFKENICHILIYYLTKFHVQVASTSWDIGQYGYCNYFFPVCDVINFEPNLRFLNKLVPFMTKKVGQKFEYLKNETIF